MEINRIINADILKGFTEIDTDSVDLVFTSPPYNIGILYDTWNDRIPWDEYYKWCAVWMSEIFRVLKPDGRFVLNHYFSLGSGKRGVDVGKKKGTSQSIDGESNRTYPLMKLNSIAVEQLGFKHHSVVSWQDITLSRKTAWGSWLSASAPYINAPYEGLLFLYKYSWKKEARGESDIDKETFISLTRGVWNIKTQPRGLTKACFSEDLASKVIRLLSYKSDLVLDPFSGSGTTCVVAKKLGRNYLGIEISPEYTRISEERINNVRS